MGNKPELLMPAGTVESFYASIEGGADAIYLGLKQFNARGRAKNFTYKQLQAIVEEAKRKSVKVYVALNTVVKNEEIKEVCEYLHFLNQINVDAIIIQDWGLFQIAKKYFPGLNIHASTQMGNHNSLGTDYSKQKGFERVILARELTYPELKVISDRSSVDIEIFIHGALCYSFSGMCLFSSYLGGSGANRGLCAQPCRRSYSYKNTNKFLFNLSDNQQLEFIGKFVKLNISSLKVEGRMKSDDYAYRVARAYRMAIDSEENLGSARDLLNHDFGRTKTGYFMAGNIKDAFSEETASGRHIGSIKKVEGNKIFLDVDIELKKGFRIRVQKPGTDDRFNLKVKEVGQEYGLQFLTFEKGNPSVGDNIFLTEIKEKKFPFKFEEMPSKRIHPIKYGYVKKIQGSILSKNSGIKRLEVFVRINSMAWLKKIHLNEVDFIILSFSKQSWKSFNIDAPFIQKFRNKIIIELPRFIPEKSIGYYENLLTAFSNKGIRNVMLSHLSQKLLVPKKCKIHTNENIYLFNDAAIQMIRHEGVINYMYPLENDIENLQKGSDRNGIVPLYFYPELFFSRMPINICKEGELQNDEKGIFYRVRKNGITSIIPDKPVSLLQYKKKLSGLGFNRYLIDVSYDKPSKNLIKKLTNRLHYSEQVQPSTTFNFKRELK